MDSHIRLINIRKSKVHKKKLREFKFVNLTGYILTTTNSIAGAYLCTNMILVSLSIFVSTFIIKLCAEAGERKRMPRWIWKVKDIYISFN